MDEQTYIQQLADSQFRLAAVETASEKHVVSLFRHLTRNTGQAVYYWQPGEGLQRIGAEHVTIPQTRRLSDALDYVASSIHFGIYLIPKADGAMQDLVVTDTLKRIAAASDRVRRLVVLMGSGLELPQKLVPMTVRMRHGMKRAS